MADNAFLWAANNKLLRKNEVHGEEEAKLILEDSFAWTKTEAERSEERTTMEVEDARPYNQHKFRILRILLGLLLRTPPSLERATSMC